MTTTTITPLGSFRNEKPYPFCPGCGHGPILDRLDEALASLGIDPAKVVLVSDIGCAGLSDQYFATSAFTGCTAAASPMPRVSSWPTRISPWSS